MLIQVVIADLMSLYAYLRVMIFSTNQALPRLYTEMDTKEICLKLIREAFLLAKYIDYKKVVDSQERR